MIAGVGGQVRLATVAGPGGSTTRPVGLDFTAVLALGQARGVDLALLADVLPGVEVAALKGSDDGGG